MSVTGNAVDVQVFPATPAVVGHRGLGKGVVEGRTENSLPSLLAAVDAGVDWVELDVTRAADGGLWVHHNPSTADGRFLVDQTPAELESDGVVRLVDVLEALPLAVRVVVDVKTVLEDATASATTSTVARLAPVLAREVARRQLLVTSFDAAALLRLREGIPDLRCGLISWLDFPLRMALPAAAQLRMDVACVHERSFAANPVEPAHVHRTARYGIDIAHAAGLEVLAWCPDEHAARMLVTAGVDAVCVNDVPRMLPFIRAL